MVHATCNTNFMKVTLTTQFARDLVRFKSWYIQSTNSMFNGLNLTLKCEKGNYKTKMENITQF